MSMTPEQMYFEQQRQILERLDKIIKMLESQASSPLDLALLAMISTALPSAPNRSSLVVVGTTPMVLAENSTLSVMRVEITNDDVAQQIYVDCNPDVLLTNGRRINAQQTIPYTINKGRILYGICIIGTVNTRVAFSQSPLSALREGQIVV